MMIAFRSSPAPRQIVASATPALPSQGTDAGPSATPANAAAAGARPRTRLADLVDAAAALDRLAGTIKFLAAARLDLRDLARFAGDLKEQMANIADLPAAMSARGAGRGGAGAARIRTFLVFEGFEIAASEDGSSARFSLQRVVFRAELSETGRGRMRLGDAVAAERSAVGEFTTRAAAMRARLQIQAQATARIERTRQGDPLIIDLAGNGFATTTLPAGRDFDLNGDGHLEHTAWLRGDDALLALDRNGNGVIDHGLELFGPRSGNGFAELAVLDDNGDDAVDRADGSFGALILLHEDGRQSRLADHGIRSIRFDVAVPVQVRLAGGDLVTEAQIERDDGAVGRIGEVLFDVRVWKINYISLAFGWEIV